MELKLIDILVLIIFFVVVVILWEFMLRKEFVDENTPLSKANSVFIIYVFGILIMMYLSLGIQRICLSGNVLLCVICYTLFRICFLFGFIKKESKNI